MSWLLLALEEIVARTMAPPDFKVHFGKSLNYAMYRPSILYLIHPWSSQYISDIFLFYLQITYGYT